MDFDIEKLKFNLIECFDDSFVDKYDFDKLVESSTVEGDFIIVNGSNFSALFDKFNCELVNMEIMEVI